MTLPNSARSLPSKQLRFRWLTVGLFLLALAPGPVALGWLVLLGCDPYLVNDASARLPLGLTAGPAFAILGGLIFRYRPHNRIGWLCLVLGFCLSTNNAVDLYAQCGLAGTIAAPGKAYAAWFLYSYGTFVILPLIFLLPMVYPTGRFLSPRWRWFTIVSLIVLTLIYTGMGLVPDLSRSNGMDRFPVANPWGVLPLPSWWFSLFYTLTNLSFVFLNLVGVAAMVVRFRRSVGDERQQMKWLAYFLTIAIGIQMLFFNLPAAFWYPQLIESIWFDVVLWLVFLGFPLVIGIAIFKYRLYAIDIIINRTLVYGGLTLLITAAYVLFVGGIGTLAANQSGQVIGLVVGTAIVVVGLRPLHRMLQMNVNRFVAVSPLPQPALYGTERFASAPVVSGGRSEGDIATDNPITSPPYIGGVRNIASIPAQRNPILHWIALVSWGLIVLAYLILFLFGLKLDYSDMLVPCAGGWDAGCNPMAISAAEVAVLSSWGLTIRTYALAMTPVYVVLLLVYWVLGGLILWRQGTSRLGLAVSLALIVLPVSTLTGGIDWVTINPNLAFLAVFVSNLGMAIVLAFFYLIPTGRFSPRWAYIPLVCSLLFLGVGQLEVSGILTLSDQATSLAFITLFSLVLLGGSFQIYRYLKDSNPIERQQTKWIFVGVLTYVLAVIVWVLIFGGVLDIPAGQPRLLANFGGWYSNLLALLILPVAITMAILRYKLWDIDLIINRTLVYGGLTLLITVVYVFLVGGISTLTANQSGQVMGLVLATGIVAVGVRPLHRSLQATADRFVAVPDLPPVGEPMNEPTMQMTDPARPRSFIRWIALVIWALIVLAHLVLFVFDLNVDFAQMLVPCSGGLDGGCNFLAISESEMAALTVWGLTPRAYALAMNLVPIIVLLVYWLLGGLILWRQGMSWFGLAVSLALIVTPIMAYSTDTDWTLVNPNLVPLGAIVVFLGTVIMLLFLYLIPNGRFSPRWAYIPMICTLLLIGGAPLEISGVIAPPAQVEPLINITTISLVLLGGGLHIYRYLRDSTPIERQQTKWILFGILSFIVAVIIWVIVFGRAVAIPDGEPRLLANFAGWLLTGLFLLALPVAITLAILRYKLWDIDVIINRTLVYGGLTLAVVLIYTLTVGGLGVLFHTTGNFIISLLATALIAIAFQPARERLQRAVNRFMFGQRDDPYAVLSHLSQQLQTTAVPTETLTSIVETIAATLKLPYVAIELVEQEAQVGQAAVGEPVGETVELPLRYQKETVGRLLVSPRAPGEKFTIKEQQLLADIAAQTGPVASATRLTLALQRSREKLVLAREEERRRIRRDLHDGLGPTLASQTLKLDIVLDMLTSDPSTAGQHVTQLKAQTQQMVADIRRLVYELRPPALDELGLLEALRSHVAQMSGTNGRLSISIAAKPDPLPALPAAIEVAAYRIALEGVTNVVRHAQASHCQVRFAITEEQPLPNLVITITDNGRGLPSLFQSGVGLTSMRERAEELGGVCTVGAAQNQGTRVRAVLPFSTNGAGR